MNCISKQPCAGRANVCIYERFIQLHSLRHLDRQFNKVFFLSLATSKNTQKLIDTGFRLALRVHVCSSEMCNYGVQRGKKLWASRSIIKKRYFLRQRARPGSRVRNVSQIVKSDTRRIKSARKIVQRNINFSSESINHRVNKGAN